jgi:acyl-ACP thioesterase
MQKNPDTLVIDLSKDVAPGDSIDIALDMKAPSSPGTYSESWALVRGGTTLCGLPVVITVK